MIYKSLPNNWSPRFEVVSCFMEFGGEILLLRRHERKSEGNRWGVPAGKIDQGESVSDAMVREIREETGREISVRDLKYLTMVYIEYPEYCFVYHMFQAKLDERPQVILNPAEHKEYLWVSPSDALNLDLVRELDACIRMYYE